MLENDNHQGEEVSSVPATTPLPPPSAPRIAPGAARTAIAPAWHTALFLLLLLVSSFANAKAGHPLLHAFGRTALYMAGMLWEVILVAYLCWGIRLRRITLKELIGGRWNSAEDALVDLALGFAVYGAIAIILYGIARSLGMFADPGQTLADAKRQLGFIAPRNGLQVGLFVLLSGVAATCEEIIFRGYFQRQFSALGGVVLAGAPAVLVGILLQAVLFGLSHGYEGRQRMTLIAAEGIILGLVAWWRKSLRPGMVAHFLQDSVAGVLLRYLLQ